MLLKFLCGLSVLAVASGTALDDYVWKEDPNYKWVDMGEDYQITGKVGDRSYKAYTLNMTSQRWLTDADFSDTSDSGSIWWHYVTVIVPDNLNENFLRNASMWITGGSMGMGKPSVPSEDITLAAALALQTGTVTSVLFQIPNEHTTFSADPKQQSRTEDAVIAYTWDHFLNDPTQPEWLLRFPMVKASLRAMDATKEFMQATLPELGTSLDYFAVSGASKRGWTTWDVGAVDPERVVAIAPVVLDAINFQKVEKHQFRSYGAWSYALTDYTDMNITERMDDPNMVHLQENVDPFFYKERLTMPKFIINAMMDEFQQPDDTHYWWDDMPEPKHFYIAPNTEHSCITGILTLVPAIGSWIQNLLLKETIPSFTWEIDSSTGEIVATLDEHGIVHSATSWYAQSCGVNAWDNDTNRRDFRIAHLDQPCTCGAPGISGYCANLKSFYKKEELEMEMVNGKRTFRAKHAAPEDGTWVAHMIEIKYVNPNARTNDLTVTMEELMEGLPPAYESKYPKEVSEQLSRKIFPDFGGFPKDFGRFYDFTTEVSVFPDTFPYPECTGAECGVQLV